MVLPEGIELSTSPLPRECSTTELRQLGSFVRTKQTRRGATVMTRRGTSAFVELLPQGLTTGKGWRECL